MLWLSRWSFLCLSVLLGHARAGILDIQDNNPALVYSGQWFADASPNAHGKHETWTNVSGASVYYDFQGSQVQVFATQRPTGTYLTNVSFQIDGNAPDFWVTNENVAQETFNKLVYTSPGALGLSTDGLHRITITNYGFVFWLVYLEITTPDVSGTGGSNTTSTSTTTGTGTQTSSAGTSGSNDSSKSASRTPVIIGAAVGSVGGVALLLAALWVWCVYTRSRRRKLEDAIAARPFAGEANPTTHLTKGRPPPNPPSFFQRWIAGSQASASELGYGYPSTGTGATENAPQEPERAQSEPEPADAGALKQLAVFRSAAEARADEGATPEREPLRGKRPPPAASIPTSLKTPHASTPQSTPRSAAAPVSRSGALARVFSFSLSSRLSRDPARARAPPTDSDATMSSALASSGVLPPPSASASTYTPSDRRRPGTVFFRALRRSQDGGVRLAGGAPLEMVRDADMMAMAPEEYDQQVLEAMSMSEGSTLPPEYQQYPTTRGEGERGGAGR